MTTLQRIPIEAYADAAAIAQVVAFAGQWYGSDAERLAVLREELTRLGLGDPWRACPWCAAPANLCPDPEGHARQHRGSETTWRRTAAAPSPLRRTGGGPR